MDEVGKNDALNEIIEASLMARPPEIGKLGGKVLRASQIRKLRGELKKKGVLLLLEEDLKIKKLTNQFKPILLNGIKFEKAQDLFYFMKKEGFAGAFDAKTKQMVLGEKATELVAFHEKAHLQHFEELGEVYHPLKPWQKETYVWEQIWSRKRNWTQKELEHSLRYVNSVREKAGIDLLKIKL
ncbi:zincin-like metallopeptidase toxin domain-containing protein [Tenacibaculum sp. SDUM215027]|uniref:zincin-like metallopeptidase toxin domain-containing protein n=1 Tax=Tenacibaculum sp. SDUM215027 TaxID=3422596 RepID=UPI003D3216B2